MYNVVFEKKVHKFFQKYKWEKIIYNLEKAVNILKINPYKNNLDIKKLKWWFINYRLRIWKYRFIYEIIENKLIIYFTDWDNRWDIYKK